RHVTAPAGAPLSCINACRELEKAGAAITFLRVDGEGRVNPDEVRRAIRPETALVSIGAACAEIGTTQPLTDIARITRAAGIPFPVDAVGAPGRIPLAGGSV